VSGVTAANLGDDGESISLTEPENRESGRPGKKCVKNRSRPHAEKFLQNDWRHWRFTR